MEIRKANAHDAEALRDLYRNHLAKHLPLVEEELSQWRAFIEKVRSDDRYHLLVGVMDGRVVSSVTVVIIPNLTHGMKPYALIENVVTHADFRGKGHASALMERACALALKAGCYKVMLMTGSKKEGTLRFYENCGFNSKEKTAFIKRFD